MARGSGTVVVSIIGKADKLKSALDTSEKDLKGFGSKVSGAMSGIGGALAGLGVAGILGGMTKAAIEDEKAQSELAKTLRNVVGASDSVVKSVEGQIEKFMKVSTFTDDDLRPAYRNLVTQTKDVDEATKLMATAMDIAAGRGVPLETVSKALAKAHDGQMGALQKLGVETKDAEGKTLSFEQVMKNANDTFGGQATAALDTTAGKSAVFKRNVQELGEEIGTKLLPLLTGLTDWLTKIVDWYSKLDGWQKTLVLSVAGLAGGLIVLNSALVALNGLLAALGFTMALPLGPVALFLALDAAIVLAYFHIKPFRDAVDALWKTFKDMPHISFDDIKDAVQWLIDKVGVLVDAIKKLPGIPGGGNAGGFVGNAIKSGLKAITPFAAGGIVNRPTLGLIGEAGPEAVIPLSRAGGLGTTVNVTVNGALDPNAVARQISDILARATARGVVA